MAGEKFSLNSELAKRRMEQAQGGGRLPSAGSSDEADDFEKRFDAELKRRHLTRNSAMASIVRKMMEGTLLAIDKTSAAKAPRKGPGGPL